MTTPEGDAAVEVIVEEHLGRSLDQLMNHPDTVSTWRRRQPATTRETLGVG